MNVSRNLNKPHRIYGGEYPKGGGAINLWWGGESPRGGSPMTTAWENRITYLTILSSPPPKKKYEFAPQIPPPPPISEAWRRHCLKFHCNL